MTRHMGLVRLVGLLVSAAIATSSRGAIIYVDDSAPPPPNGANDGTSWVDAFTDLQDALAIAEAGDEIRIAQGVYRPAPPGGPREATFNLVDGVIIQGGYAGFGALDPDELDPKLHETILSGDLNGDDIFATGYTNYGENSHHVVTADNLGPSSILRGLTITAGSADVQEDPYCTGEASDGTGGGLAAFSCSFIMEDCVIARNQAACAGGGAHLTGGSPKFIRCRFQANRARGDTESYGGGLYNTGTASFVACEFINNHSDWYSGGIASRYERTLFRSCIFRGNSAGENVGGLGGGYVTCVECTFDDNSSGHGVGGASVDSSSVINCTFRGNTGGIALYFGTALRAWGDTTIANCTFTGNTGGASPIGVQFGTIRIDNCTIVGNETCCIAAIYVDNNGTLELSNSIVWGNTNFYEKPIVPLRIDGEATITHSLIQGWTGSLGGVGNHGNDPRFVDADGPDNIYGTSDDNPRLMPNSPCIDTGDASLLPADTHDLDDDGDTTEPLPLDLDLLPRIVGVDVDMGAYEFQGAPCRADIDGSGAVGVSDLLTVVSTWGPCPVGQPCNADLDLNMTVNVADLLQVISTFGPCP